jgi:hypothetical protein
MEDIDPILPLRMEWRGNGVREGTKARIDSNSREGAECKVANIPVVQTPVQYTS